MIWAPEGPLVNLAATLLERLDDPLSVGLAESRRGVSEAVSNLLVCSQVLKRRDTLGLGRCVNSHADLIADIDAKVAEAVRIVGNPLVPSIKGTVRIERDTCLQDGSLASIAIDADPSRSSSTVIATDFGDGDGTLNFVVAIADLDGAGPVARVLVVAFG
ncbi:hypothetical protein HG530_010454 [Fusarium avenaceum]|nr:hypothetical protein HG530_010454 [Fusarium avenaceum]